MADATQNVLGTANSCLALNYADQAPLDAPTPEQIAARQAAIEQLITLVDAGKSSSGRNGKPWREYIHEGHQY